VNPDHSTFQEIQSLISRETDWKCVIEFAISQQVAPLIYYNLKQYKKQDLIPSKYFAILKKKYIAAYAWNVVIFDEMKLVLELFQQAGIAAVVLKGPALLDVVYKDWGVRKTSDIDLLVRMENLNRAQVLLLEHNYFSVSETSLNSDGTPISHHMAGIRRTYFSPSIELHWTLRSNNKLLHLDIDAIWKRAKPGKINNTDVLLLSPEDMILHLCIHHFYKFKASIAYREINDIVAVIQQFRDELDWEQILENSLRYKIAPLVYAGLFFANQWLPEIIPPAILGALKTEYSNEYFGELYILKKLEEQFYSVSDKLSASEKFSHKLKEIVVSLFPPQQKLCEKYGLSNARKQIYRYRILHPYKMLLKRIIPMVHFGMIFLEKFWDTVLKKTGHAKVLSPTANFSIE